MDNSRLLKRRMVKKEELNQPLEFYQVLTLWVIPEKERLESPPKFPPLVPRLRFAPRWSPRSHPHQPPPSPPPAGRPAAGGR